MGESTAGQYSGGIRRTKKRVKWKRKIIEQRVRFNRRKHILNVNEIGSNLNGMDKKLWINIYLVSL
jgi:hypothetical protein